MHFKIIYIPTQKINKQAPLGKTNLLQVAMLYKVSYSLVILILLWDFS